MITKTFASDIDSNGPAESQPRKSEARKKPSRTLNFPDVGMHAREHSNFIFFGKKPIKTKNEAKNAYS